jgi:aryl-alcohol dehydrogenase-like predicted oxidoreductase
VRFALTSADVATAVVGLATIDHLEEACAGAAMGPLPTDALAALQRLYKNGFAG